MEEIWKHIMRHVKPHQEAWKIKANLEIKDFTRNSRKLDLKKRIELLKEDIESIQKHNKRTEKEIIKCQEKCLVKDRSLRTLQLKKLSFWRDVKFIRIHKSECMSLAREIEALTQSIKIIYEKFKVPALEKEEEENEQLSAEVSCLIGEIKDLFVSNETFKGESAKDKIMNLVEKYDHSSVLEEFLKQSRNQLCEMERLKQQVKNKVTETKEKTGTAELEEDVLELTTKLNGMQSHVHELKSRVIPEYKLRNSRMKEELVRTIQNRMAVDGDPCWQLAEITCALAAKRGLIEYYQNELKTEENEYIAHELDVVQNMRSKSDLALTIAAKGFTEKIYQNSVLLQDIRQYKPAVPQLLDVVHPSGLRSLKIKEVQLLLSSFEKLLTTQQPWYEKESINLLPPLNVMTKRKTIDSFLRIKSLDEFMNSTQQTFEAKRLIFSKNESRVQNARDKIEEIYKKREGMEKSLFPRLKAKLERAEKEKETLECSQKALDNWMKEPGKNAIMPFRTVDNLTFEEWQAKVPMFK
ncbi:uncharacterized protein LOC136042732 isoform X2 [Artemia franciscana]